MRSPLKAVKTKGTLFVLVSLAVLAGSIAGGGGQVEAASNEFRIISTLAGNDHFVTTWWHGNNGGSNVDTIRDDGNPTAGAGVYWQSSRTSGSATLTITVLSYSNACKSSRVSVRHGAQGLGDYWWFHIDDELSPGTTWTASSSYTIKYVGKVASSETCSAWTGVHLHQGGDNGPTTSLFTHWTLQSDVALSHQSCNTWNTNPCRLNTVNKFDTSWVHRWQW